MTRTEGQMRNLRPFGFFAAVGLAAAVNRADNLAMPDRTHPAHPVHHVEPNNEATPRPQTAQAADQPPAAVLVKKESAVVHEDSTDTNLSECDDTRALTLAKVDECLRAVAPRFETAQQQLEVARTAYSADQSNARLTEFTDAFEDVNAWAELYNDLQEQRARLLRHTEETEDNAALAREDTGGC